ncbi:MAG: periplasmic-type flagellar collar protein FlbB [Brevinematia bacterium]
MGKRILILLFGNLALLTIAMMIFDSIGIIDYRSFLYDNFPFIRSYLEQKLEDPKLLEKESLLRYKQELDYLKRMLDDREKKISEIEKELSAKEAELQQKLSMVEEMRSSLEKQQKIFKDYDEKITKVATYINSLPPDDASKILENMNDDMIVDVLLKIDRISERQGTLSISSFLLSKLPPDRAARISEKIMRK